MVAFAIKMGEKDCKKARSFDRVYTFYLQTGNTNVFGTSWTKALDENEAKCIRECPNPPEQEECDDGATFKAEEHCDILSNTNGPFKVLFNHPLIFL